MNKVVATTSIDPLLVNTLTGVHSSETIAKHCTLELCHGILDYIRQAAEQSKNRPVDFVLHIGALEVSKDFVKFEEKAEREFKVVEAHNLIECLKRLEKSDIGKLTTEEMLGFLYTIRIASKDLKERLEVLNPAPPADYEAAKRRAKKLAKAEAGLEFVTPKHLSRASQFCFAVEDVKCQSGSSYFILWLNAHSTEGLTSKVESKLLQNDKWSIFIPSLGYLSNDGKKWSQSILSKQNYGLFTGQAALEKAEHMHSVLTCYHNDAALGGVSLEQRAVNYSRYAWMNDIITAEEKGLIKWQ